MNLRALASRAARRSNLIELERALLREATRGLAASVVVLLASAAALAVLEPYAPLGDEARTLAMSLGAALAACGAAIGTRRGLARRTSPLAAAFALDRSLGLSGELPAALELETSEDPFARLAVESALEKARAADLARAIPRTPPPESLAAPWLLVAVVALTVVVGSRRAPREPLPPPPHVVPRSPAEKEDLARAARALAEAAATLAVDARETDATLEVQGPASRALDELERTARALARGTLTRQGALSAVADARGRVEASRLDGLPDALDGVPSTLAQAPALAPLARALQEGEPRAIKDAARDLAEKLRSGALTEDAQAQAAQAAARAARSLEGTNGAADAKSSLERLSRSIDQESSPDEKAQAAGNAGDKLAKARAAAGSDQVAQRALDALDAARDAAKGLEKPSRSSPGEGGTPNGKPHPGAAPPKDDDQGLAQKGGERPGSLPGGSRAGDGSGSQKREGSTPGNGGGADEKPGNKGDPAGSGLGSHVAGKGGTNEEATGGARAESEPEPLGPSSTLAGLLGSRGASAIFAVRGIARGAAPARHEREIIQDYRRTEEEALERELVPLDQRRLVQRYFEAIAARRPAEKPAQTPGGDR